MSVQTNQLLSFTDHEQWKQRWTGRENFHILHRALIIQLSESQCYWSLWQWFYSMVSVVRQINYWELFHLRNPATGPVLPCKLNAGIVPAVTPWLQMGRLWSCKTQNSVGGTIDLHMVDDTTGPPWISALSSPGCFPCNECPQYIFWAMFPNAQGKRADILVIVHLR